MYILVAVHSAMVVFAELHLRVRITRMCIKFMTCVQVVRSRFLVLHSLAVIAITTEF